MFGVLHGLRQRIDFRRHEGPCARHLRQPGDTFRGSLRAVRGAERVVHEHVAERRVLLCEFRVVFLFALIAAAVFKHHHFARLHLDAVQVVFDESDRQPHQLAHAHRHARQRIFRTAFAFRRAPQVAHHEHRSAAVHRKPHRRHACNETRFIRNTAFFIARNIQIAADQHTAAVQLTGLRQSFQRKNLHESLTS